MWYHLKSLRNLLPLLLASAPLLAERGADPLSATLDVAQGKAYLRNAEGSTDEFSEIQSGSPVVRGRWLKTSADFVGKLHFEDQSELTLKPQSEIQLLEDGLRLLKGSVWIKVTKRNGRFVVVTPSAIASVRGTQFSCRVPSVDGMAFRILAHEALSITPAKYPPVGNIVSEAVFLRTLLTLMTQIPGGKPLTTVAVYEGAVSVSQRDGRSGKVVSSVVLNPGEMATASAAGLGKTRAIPVQGYTEWGLTPPATGDAPVAPAAAPGSPEENSHWFDGPPVHLLDQTTEER